jgi:hypothetical protein
MRCVVAVTCTNTAGPGGGLRLEPLGGEPLFGLADPVAAEDDLPRRGLDVRGDVGQVRGEVALQRLRVGSSEEISIHLAQMVGEGKMPVRVRGRTLRSPRVLRTMV